MKPNKFSVCLSAIAMIGFLICSVICYFKVNNRINNIEYTPTVAIFNFTQTSTSMDINPFDMIEKKTDAISSSEAVLDVMYESNSNHPYTFNIVMENYSSYTKTNGVDGVNSFEYTYEVLRNDHIIVTEREIDSYEAGSKVILAYDTLDGSINDIEYKIIFRFYTNEYDQSHLLGTTLSSKLSVVPMES